jgi:uncharacterized iron-regulated membrane protein
VLSATVISYPWASNLVYRLVGEEPPAQGGLMAAPATDVNFTGFDTLWSHAEQQAEQEFAGWLSISLRLPSSANAPLVFTIDQGNGGQPQKRAQLTMDRATGEVARWEPFASMTLGRRLRMVLRFAHTGEVAGILGQTIAGVVSAGASVLVYTGIALTWRRFRSWQVRRRSQESAKTLERTVQPDQLAYPLTPVTKMDLEDSEASGRPLLD